MKNYTVWNFKDKMVDWEAVEPLSIDTFPWYKKGEKQLTYVKMVLSNETICLKVECEDTHSYAAITEFNGSVYKDSCFEFFLTPNEDRGSAYLNFETNCCRTLHVGYGEDIDGRILSTIEQGSKVVINSSIIGPCKEEQSGDLGWQLSMEIPLSLIEEMSILPISKTLWYGDRKSVV